MKIKQDDRIPDIDSIAEARYEMFQSEIDEAVALGMSVKQLREEKEAHRIYKEEIEMYDQLPAGIY